MKTRLFLLIFSASCLIYCDPIQDHKIDPVALSKLTRALGIPEGSNLIEETQKRWLRRAGTERWEMEELKQQQLLVLNLSEELGLCAEWKPSLLQYDKAFILGATTPRMQIRLNFLKKLWIQGIRFDEVVWLTGMRPLDARVDGLVDRCSNESEAAHVLWEEADLPEEMKNLPVLFVETKAENVRPNTKDTIVAYLDTDLKPCRALFVSNQPFCGYQFAVIKSVLPEAFSFDVVGESADFLSLPAAAAVTLDALTRWMYQESLDK